MSFKPVPLHAAMLKELTLWSYVYIKRLRIHVQEIRRLLWGPKVQLPCSEERFTGFYSEPHDLSTAVK